MRSDPKSEMDGAQFCERIHSCRGILFGKDRLLGNSKHLCEASLAGFIVIRHRNEECTGDERGGIMPQR
jgi:hypothetical protein